LAEAKTQASADFVNTTRCCGGCRKFFCFSFRAILCRDINWQMRFFLPTRQRQGNFHFDHKRHVGARNTGQGFKRTRVFGIIHGQPDDMYFG